MYICLLKQKREHSYSHPSRKWASNALLLVGAAQPPVAPVHGGSTAARWRRMATAMVKGLLATPADKQKIRSGDKDHVLTASWSYPTLCVSQGVVPDVKAKENRKVAENLQYGEDAISSLEILWILLAVYIMQHIGTWLQSSHLMFGKGFADVANPFPNPEHPELKHC